jgi:hypothetical protein
MPPWVSFEYRDFYDVPRQIIVSHRGHTFLLDCPFDEVREDYAAEYDILEFPELAAHAVRDSKDLRGLATRILGRVPVVAVRFDPTRRSQVDIASIPLLAGL